MSGADHDRARWYGFPANAALFALMPIYEYRCPEGHTFELFQRMSDPPPAACEVCGAEPVSKVLYPAAIHFKGSGFYSTDYGRGNRKREGEKAEAGSSDSQGPEKTEKKSEPKPEKKAPDPA